MVRLRVRLGGGVVGSVLVATTGSVHSTFIELLLLITPQLRRFRVRLRLRLRVKVKVEDKVKVRVRVRLRVRGHPWNHRLVVRRGPLGKTSAPNLLNSCSGALVSSRCSLIRLLLGGEVITTDVAVTDAQGVQFAASVCTRVDIHGYFIL